APATRRASCFTRGPGNGKPRSDSSVTVKRPTPGRSIASGPAMRSGSRGFSIPASGPSASGGMTRVSRRQYTASVPSSSSTRSESKLLRTDQSIPLPIIAAISLGESTTESGPSLRLRRSTFVWLDESALGVGAPTAVSATGGSLVEWGPSQREAPCRSGSRNHHATSATTSAAAKRASRNSPLRQPFTVSHVVHRTSRLERALHQVERAHHARLRELELRERRLEPGEVAGSGFPFRAPQRHVGTKRARLRGKPEWRELLLHPMLQDLEPRLRRDPGPHHARPAEIGEYAEPSQRERQGARPRRRPLERRRDLRLPVVRHLTEKLERQVDAVSAHPIHGEPQLPQRARCGPQRLAHGGRKIQRDEQPHAPAVCARPASRLPRR